MRRKNFDLIFVILFLISYLCAPSQLLRPRNTAFSYHSLPHYSKYDCLGGNKSPRWRHDSLWEENFFSVRECLEEQNAFDHSGNEEMYKDYPLPKTVNPIHYLIKLCPLARKPFTFTGSVEIELEVKEPTREIVLNMKDLEIHSVSLKHYRKTKPERDEELSILESSVNKPIFRRTNSKFKDFRKQAIYQHFLKNDSVSKFSFNDKENELTEENGKSDIIPLTIVTINKNLEKVTIECEEDLEVNHTYKLKIEFNGVVSTNLSGLYMSYHFDHDDVKRYSMVTQFQMSEARKVFPCFDEPRFRSSFTLILCREKSFKTLSNMPKIATVESKDDDNIVWDVFQKSLQMPTYLVAFAVLDDYEFNKCNYSLNPVKVWAPSFALNLTHFGCEMTPPLLKFFESYFQVSYSLPKIDLLALYEFRALGMENWGLATFTIDRLLVDHNDANSLSAQYDVLDTISHEIIHQWFGNLVSPASWPNLWLSEGFASYFSLLGVDQLRPEWQILKDKIISIMHFTMVDDSMESTHAMVVQTNSPKEHALLFDAIAYGKGCFVVRMMLHFLSEEVFKLGLHNYLKEMKYQSVYQDDLWRFLTKVGHESGVLAGSLSMKEIMETWTMQKGHPVVNVQRFSNGTLALSQKRFYANSEEELQAIRAGYHNPSDRPKWWIPLSIATKLNPNFEETSPKYWMNSYEHSWHLEELSRQDNWYVFNVQQTGFFRVNYDENNWLALIQQLRENHEVFDEITRAQLIDESFTLSFAEQLAYDIPFDMILYIKNEISPFVLRTVVNNLEEFSPALNEEEDIESQATLLPLLIHHYPPNGFLNHSAELPFIRETTNHLVKIVCKVYTPCIKEAKFVFSQWTKKFNNIYVDDDLVSTIISIGTRDFEEKKWDRLFRRFVSISDPSEKERLLSFLTSTTDVDRLSMLLNNLSEDLQEIKSPRYLPLGMKQIAKNPKTTQFAWEYLQQIWPKLKGTPNELDYFTSVVPYLRTKKQHQELDEFVGALTMESSSISKNLLQKFSRRLQTKIEFENRKSVGLQSWLKRRRTIL